MGAHRRRWAPAGQCKGHCVRMEGVRRWQRANTAMRTSGQAVAACGDHARFERCGVCALADDTAPAADRVPAPHQHGGGAVIGEEWQRTRGGTGTLRGRAGPSALAQGSGCVWRVARDASTRASRWHWPCHTPLCAASARRPHRTGPLALAAAACVRARQVSPLPNDSRLLSEPPAAVRTALPPRRLRSLEPRSPCKAVSSRRSAPAIWLHVPHERPIGT